MPRSPIKTLRQGALLCVITRNAECAMRQLDQLDRLVRDNDVIAPELQRWDKKTITSIQDSNVSRDLIQCRSKNSQTQL